MTGSVESPERIWVETEGGCPYFYHEDELSDVSPPITEYVRADKLRAEIEALRAEVEVWKASFEQAASGHAVYSERTEQLEALVRELEGREQRDEDLLRQALEVLEQGAWDTLRGRNAAAAIRERLGEGEQQ